MHALGMCMWCQHDGQYQFTHVTDTFIHRMAWPFSWRQANMTSGNWRSMRWTTKRMSTGRTKWNRLEKSHVVCVLLIAWRRLCKINLKAVRSNSLVVSFCDCLLLYMQREASTALMIAAQEGNCGMIQLLLSRGADINAVNEVIIGPNAVTV